MKKLLSSSFIFVLCIGVLLSFYVSADAQYLHIQKRNPLVEEIVSKISLEELTTMHDKLVSFETRNTFSDTVSNTRGIGAARRYIYSKFQEFSEASGGRLQVYFDKFDQPLTGRRLSRVKERTGQDTYRMVNVVALLPGNADDVRYIVNGHYDSMPRGNTDGETTGPGANDDGSGTVVMMELARVLSQYEFEHTLMFVANVGEEQGLLGAHHMAKTAEAEGWEIAGVFADDIVGNIHGGNGITDDTAVRAFSPDPGDSKSRHLARYAKYIGEPYVPNLKINLVFRLDRFGRGGDHSAFIRRGYAGVRFTELNENFYHQHDDNTDRAEFTSRPYMTKVARIQSAILSTAGLAPRTVNMLRPFRQRDVYKTVLQWEHSTKETDIAGYKVFLRKTDQGYWQEIIDVGMPEQAKARTRRDGQIVEIDVYKVLLQHRSIDDYIFGIVAYDRDGNESMVSTYEEPDPNRRR